MTRGKMVIILSGSILVSQEYNGDMGYESVNDNGRKAISLLASIDASKSETGILADFTDKIKAFTIDFYKSKNPDPESPLVRCAADADIDCPTYIHMLDFSNEYISKWFSDYLYVRDFGNKYKANCSIRDMDHQVVCLKTENVYVFYFGKLIGHFVCDTVCDRPWNNPLITPVPGSDNISSDIKPDAKILRRRILHDIDDILQLHDMDHAMDMRIRSLRSSLASMDDNSFWEDTLAQLYKDIIK